MSDEPQTTIHLSFLGPRELIGKSAPGTHRAYTHFVQKYPFVGSLNYSYTGPSANQPTSRRPDH